MNLFLNLIVGLNTTDCMKLKVSDLELLINARERERERERERVVSKKKRRIDSKIDRKIYMYVVK